MTARPHVVIEALQVRQNPAGTGRAILDLCSALADRDRELEFTVLTTAPSVFEAVAGRPGWQVRECSAARGTVVRKALFTQLKLPGLVKELGGDLLHCQQFLVPLRCPCPLVTTVHDLAWLRYPHTIEKMRLAYYRWLVPRSLARATAIVANSRATEEDIAQFFPEAVPKTSVTPFGTPAWALAKMETASQSSDPPARPYFLFVGTLEPRKNLTRLLEAYETFLASDAAAQLRPDEIPDLLLAGGRGWKETELRRRMEGLLEKGRLTVLDYCGPDRLWDLYRNALALVFPSLHEGFGFPVLEAMAAGLPVLTSTQGATAEVAGDAALLVDPENTGEIAAGLARMAFDDDLRRGLAAGGPARTRRWSWARTADLTCDLYRRLLASKADKKGLPQEI